ncbi:10110_t:CDS:1 [Funneliformis mosseae]|uniref:10110_t:CDS:1 n=1 Tax=Funneliformis mosseae TaxID=27381 RepID=A0A9N8Z6L8_FUNMO|nr:10110_t:CDS:1 [Funneliformis mosseae]
MSTKSLEKALPTECIHEIISHLTQDSKALNNCIRTNRLFARLSAPLLYKNPWKYFSIEEEEGELVKREINPKGALLIGTYLSCLENDLSVEFSSLKENYILITAKTSLDYISFTRHISVPTMYRFLEAMVATATTSNVERSRMIQEAFLALSKAFNDRCTSIDSLETCWQTTCDIFSPMIRRFPNVAHLDLLQYENTDDTLRFIIENCKRLRVFKLVVRNCTPILLSNLVEKQKGCLDELCIKITASPKLLLAGLSPSVIAKITDLRINGLQIDHALDGLKFQKLRSLDISDCHSVEDKTFNVVEFGKMLTEVNLSETKVSEEAIIALASHCKQNLRKMIMLPCGAADSVEKGIKALATHCPNLVEFRLDVIRVEIKSIMDLVKSCKGMQVLVLGGVEINNEDCLLDELMESIRSNISHSITMLDLREWGVSENSVIELVRDCRKLSKLFLRYCRNVNDNCIKSICKFLAGNLKHLDVSNCPLVTPDVITKAELELVDCRIIYASRLYCIDI